MLTMHINYNDQSLTAIDRDGEPWFTAAVAGAGLGYAEGMARQSVINLFNRNRDEFSDADTYEIKLVSQDQARQTRIFSLSGIVLLGFFSGTEKAKAFRKWAKAELEKRMAYQLGYRAEPVAPATSNIPTAEYVDLLKTKIAFLQANKPEATTNSTPDDRSKLRRRWTEHDKMIAIDLYNQGQTTREIADFLNRPLESIRTHLKRAGVYRNQFAPVHNLDNNQ